MVQTVRNKVYRTKYSLHSILSLTSSPESWDRILVTWFATTGAQRQDRIHDQAHSYLEFWVFLGAFLAISCKKSGTTCFPSINTCISALAFPASASVTASHEIKSLERDASCNIIAHESIHSTSTRTSHGTLRNIQITWDGRNTPYQPATAHCKTFWSSTQCSWLSANRF